ncbi:MAG: AraC family transcriptional regulator [Paludibacteraceae bacterium]|nr:AraC family transcriptional regulator [Paludibacteraceae bacterium]
MQPKILHIRSVNDYARYISAPELHPLVSVIHYDELTAMRHSLNSYEVYAMFLNDGELPELTYGTLQYNMPQHTLMCVAPGQIGGKEDADEIIHAKGWALLFDPKLLHDTFLGKQMNRYRFFSYNTSEPLLMTEEERGILVDCLEHLRASFVHGTSILRTSNDLSLVASWLSLILEYCLRFYSRQFKMQSSGEKGLLHRLETVLDTYYDRGLQAEQGLPSVSYCASQLCLSAGYFGDLIHEATGDTATAFIHRYIIRRANELLRAGGSVSTAAYDLGFQTPSHFSRVYKKVSGFPPSAYK